MSDFRIIMENGRINDLLFTNDEERRAVGHIKKLDDLLLELRTLIRMGKNIKEDFILENLYSYSDTDKNSTLDELTGEVLV